MAVTPAVRVALIGLLAAGRSGVPRYTTSLLRALDGVSGEYPDLELELVTTKAGADSVRPTRLITRLVGEALGNPREGIRRLLSEQLAARQAQADVLHFFDLTGPVFAPRRKFVTTLHDATGTQGRRLLRFGYKRWVQPWALRHANEVVAVSASSRDDAAARFGIDPERITVIHSGPGLETSHAAAEQYGERNGAFLLYIGDLSTHKNLHFLLDVFERAGKPDRLILAGRPGDRYSELRARIAASPAAGRVVTLIDPSDQEIDRLYRQAVATVLPSRQEGFGFTPLEAMARDCPVLASDIPALREIAGDGALLLPLDSEEDWVQSVVRVTDNEDFRSTLRERGRKLVARYSWTETARGLCELFRRVGR